MAIILFRTTRYLCLNASPFHEFFLPSSVHPMYFLLLSSFRSCNCAIWASCPTDNKLSYNSMSPRDFLLCIALNLSLLLVSLLSSPPLYGLLIPPCLTCQWDTRLGWHHPISQSQVQSLHASIWGFHPNSYRHLGECQHSRTWFSNSLAPYPVMKTFSWLQYWKYSLLGN